MRKSYTKTKTQAAVTFALRWQQTARFLSEPTASRCNTFQFSHPATPAVKRYRTQFTSSPPTRTRTDTGTPRSAAPQHGSAPRPQRAEPAGSRQPNPARGAWLLYVGNLQRGIGVAQKTARRRFSVIVRNQQTVRRQLQNMAGVRLGWLRGGRSGVSSAPVSWRITQPAELDRSPFLMSATLPSLALALYNGNPHGRAG